MALRQVSGAKRPAGYVVDRQTKVRDPMVLIYANGKAQMTARCADLVAVTAATDPAVVGQVSDFGARVPDDASWTKEQVAALCRLLGRMAYPRLLQVEHLVGQGSLLLRGVAVEGPGVTALTYPRRGRRPIFNALPVLKEEGIVVPAGMCLEVPVAPVLDDGVLKVEARLLKGVERVLMKRQPGEV